MALTRDQRLAAKEKWKDIQRNKAPERLNITFPCTKQDIHTVSIIKGDLFFHNHKMQDLKALAIMDKLNSPTVTSSNACGCIKMMRFFMEHLSTYDVGYGFFPSSVRDALGFPASKKYCRKEFQAVFPAPIPAEQVIKNKFCDLMKTTFLKAITYRRPTHEVFKRAETGVGDYVQEAVPFNLTVSVGAEPSIEGYLKENKQRGATDEPTINVVLPLSYYSRVFTKGLAVVDGNIILARLYDFDNGSFLGLVGKQTYGYKITKEYAVIHPERNHISYIGEEKAKEILVNGKTPRSRRTKKELGK